MAVNVNAKVRKLSAGQGKKVEARAAELIAEEMTLRELRTARSPRTVFRAWKSVATFCFRRCGKPWRHGWRPLAGCKVSDQPPVVLAGIAESEPPPKRRRGRARS